MSRWVVLALWLVAAGCASAPKDMDIYDKRREIGWSVRQYLDERFRYHIVADVVLDSLPDTLRIAVPK